MNTGNHIQCASLILQYSYITGINLQIISKIPLTLLCFSIASSESDATGSVVICKENTIQQTSHMLRSAVGCCCLFIDLLLHCCCHSHRCNTGSTMQSISISHPRLHFAGGSALFTCSIKRSPSYRLELYLDNYRSYLHVICTL